MLIPSLKGTIKVVRQLSIERRLQESQFQFCWHIECCLDDLNLGVHRGIEWNGTGTETCVGQTQPFFGSTYPAGPLPHMALLENVLENMERPAYLLNITTLSQFRKDAHISIYSNRKGRDCLHWCVGGLPDTWNLLLYTALFF
ncbi:hypothetical protein AMTR_s00021p00121970 [Amborella trichopoda]|uniref:Trichome birefringence-like C-terminal domain-containing protein n=1 Tax=Amborella trichopoda TaxID=13333 RepID=W1Q0I6_AMBTC|nr:hypothetical protein AMTR_s00021p00121970 [Amborella trichopoda]